MDTKRFVIGTGIGGVTVFGIGTLLVAIAPFRDFFAYAMNAGSATGVAREPQLVWAVALGALSYGALVTLAIGGRRTPVNVGEGIRVGAVVGFMLWFTADLMLYGVSNVGHLTSTLIDPLLELVPGAIAGGVIAAVLGRIGSTRTASA
jgi:hypothetical protein